SVLAAWLTVGLVFHAAFWLFCRRAALFAALATGSGVLFCRSMLRAETDGLTSLFVSAAIYCIWRASSTTGHAHASVGHGTPFARPWLWFHLSSVAIALAFMTKGPPGLF